MGTSNEKDDVKPIDQSYTKEICDADLRHSRVQTYVRQCGTGFENSCIASGVESRVRFSYLGIFCFPFRSLRKPTDASSDNYAFSQFK